jgi:hypothetical protein
LQGVVKRGLVERGGGGREVVEGLVEREMVDRGC